MSQGFVRRTREEFDFSRAKVFRKRAPLAKANVEVAARRQSVVTTVDGLEETRSVAEPGDRIVTGARGERYVIKAQKFDALYEEDAADPSRYRSKTLVRALPLKEDTELRAPWDEWQRAKKGGFVVQRIGAPDDVYLIAESVFKATYAPEPGRASRQKRHAR